MVKEEAKMQPMRDKLSTAREQYDRVEVSRRVEVSS